MTDGLIHIVTGDLEMLAARAAALDDDLQRVDTDGTPASIGAAMPGSLSSGAAVAAIAGLRESVNALGSRYAIVESSTTKPASAHRSNDEATAGLLLRADSGSALRWATEKGLA